MTEAEFSQQLSQLSSVAADLNRESDSINDLLSQYEAKIRAMNVGLEVSVPLGAPHTVLLQWKKLDVYGGKDEKGYRTYTGTEWGLAITVGLNSYTAVLERSREERIAALESIPGLVTKLTQAAQDRVDVIRKAKDLLK
jgi:hypothetical protein